MANPRKQHTTRAWRSDIIRETFVADDASAADWPTAFFDTNARRY